MYIVVEYEICNEFGGVGYIVVKYEICSGYGGVVMKPLEY